MRRHERRYGAWALALGLGLTTTAGCRDDATPTDDDGTGSTSSDDADGPDTAVADDTSTGGTDTDDPPPTAGSTDTDDPPDPPDPEQAVPPPGGLRRLLAPQYLASLEYLLGPEAAAVAVPPIDPTLGTFDSLGTLSSVPSVPDIETYEVASRLAAQTALDNPDRLAELVPCVTAGPEDDGCYESLARDFGRVAWRRTLTDEQVDRLVSVATTAREWAEDDFDAGVEFMLTAILQSPYFLYMVELGDPGETYRELNGVELATRMSFFLIGRTPSVDVLDRAEQGELDTDEGVRALAWELLEDPLARDTLGRFVGEMFTTRNIASKGKDPLLFPMFNNRLRDAMMDETRRLVDDVVFVEEQSALRIFDADYTFINNDLAGLYGYGPVPTGQWQRVDLPEGRAGVLSLSGWLTMSSHNTVNSPTRRGLYVMEQLLCNEVPLPPPRVNPEPVEPAEGQTLRESLMQHMEDPACNGCHALTDPIGFGFEHLNPIGAWQDLDNGLPVDASGNLPGVGEFYGADQMAALLVQQPELPRCLVDKVYAGNLGFIPEEPMAPALDAVSDAFTQADHDLRLMLVELTASPVFRLVDEPK